MKYLNWIPTTKFMIKDEKIELSIPLKKKKYSIDSEKFLFVLDNIENNDTKELLLNQNIFDFDNNVSEEIKKGITHWKNRKWTPSLDLYLYSRNINYIDKNDLTGDIRRKIINEYNLNKLEKINKLNYLKEIDLSNIENIEKQYNLEEFFKNIKNRKSIRVFDNTKNIKLEDLIYVLKNGTEKIKRTRILEKKEENPLKSYACSFNFYIIVFNIIGLVPGIYFYDIEEDKLYLKKEIQLNMNFSKYIASQPFTETALFTILITANFELYQWRYRHERALRQLYIEIGRVTQYLLMSGLEKKLDSIETPALSDRKLGKLIEVDILRELPVISLTMGKRK